MKLLQMKKRLFAAFLVLFVPIVLLSGNDYQAERVFYRKGQDRCFVDISFKEKSASAPVIVWFHGGGLTGGKANTPDEFLTENYTVASVEYRLFPQAGVKEIIDDAAKAVAWICENIGSYGGNPSRIFLAGHSAGGYLVSMLALDKHYLAKYGIDADRFAAVVPYSGQMITHFTERKSRGIPKTCPLVDEMAPLYHIRPDAPPFLLMTGGRELEMLRRYEENAYFYEMMKLVGHKNIILDEFDGFNHGGMVKPGHLVFMGYIKKYLRTQSVRVMSYNVRYSTADDGENNWENRRAATPTMLRDIKPDIFGVQEAMKEQIDFILEKCPSYMAVGVGREDGVSEGEHMSVFYNADILELVDWGNYWLSETPWKPSIGWDAACKRTATWTLMRVKATGKLFYFVNTHLDHRGVMAKRNGLALVFDSIQKMNKEGYPMVLTGDFNVLPDNPCLSELDSLMVSARKSARKTETKGSFNGYGHPEKSKAGDKLHGKVLSGLRPIDYIYHKGFSSNPVFRVVDKQYNDITFISDHYPIYADLIF